MARKKKVTLAMLADQLGLSVYTVSKALRGLPGMSESTRKEVVDAARQLGYLTKDQENSLLYEGIPRLSARQRRFLLVTSSDSVYRSPSIKELYEGLKERLSDLGHKIDLAFIPEQTPPQQFDGWAEQEGVPYADGLFITARIPQAVEPLLLAVKLPRILINYPEVGSKVDSVIWDVSDATRQSVRYLLASGHRNILYFGDANKTRGYKQRWKAFVDEMGMEGLHVREEDHLTSMPLDQQQWMDAFISHMQRVRPTALLCATEMNLPWIYYACSGMGLQIPQDISLIRLDHITGSLSSNITHPVLLMKETGYRAADRMLWRIANPHLPYEHIRLQGPFFGGSTVKRLNVEDVRDP